MRDAPLKLAAVGAVGWAIGQLTHHQALGWLCLSLFVLLAGGCWRWNKLRLRRRLEVQKAQAVIENTPAANHQKLGAVEPVTRHRVKVGPFHVVRPYRPRFNHDHIKAATFQFHAGTQATLDPKFHEALADALTHRMGYPMNALVLPVQMTVTVRETEAPRVVPELPEKVAFSRDLLSDSRYMLLLGVDAYGQPHYWNAARIPHIGLAGDSGEGKSSGARVLVADAGSKEWALYLGDPEVVSLGCMRDLPGVVQVATDFEAIAKMIYDVDEERAYRRDQLGVINRKSQFQPLMLLLDEYTHIMAWACTNEGVKQPEQTELYAAVRRLAQLGRKVNIHLVPGAQQPNAKILPTEARDQVKWVSYGEASEQLAGMIRQRRQQHPSGPRPELPPGRMEFRGEVLQGPWLPEVDDEDLSPEDKGVVDRTFPERGRTGGIEPQANVVSMFHRTIPRAEGLKAEGAPGGVVSSLAGEPAADERAGQGVGNALPLATPGDATGNTNGNTSSSGRCPKANRAVATCFARYGCDCGAGEAWDKARRKNPTERV